MMLGLARNVCRPRVLRLGWRSISGGGYKWDILASVCIERPPYITPSLPDMESKTLTLLQQKEFEQSMLNDHELKHKRDMERQERKARGEELEESEAVAVITALDMEDSWKKSAEGFIPAATESAADKSADLRSTKRAMASPLRLVARYHLGSDIFWDLPNIKHQAGETLRDTAERAVTENLGGDVDVTILGNAPWSFYKFKYPKHFQQSTEREGAKVWIFKGILMNHFHDEPQVKLGKHIEDYQWLTRTELEKNLHSKAYKALDNMLLSED